MYYLDPDAYLEELRSKYPESPTITDLLLAMDAFHDLRLYQLADGRVMFCSFDTGPYMDKVEFWMEGSILWAARYIEDMGMRIYDEPPVVNIATVNPEGFGLIPEPELEEDLKTLGWYRKEIQLVMDYLANSPPINY